MGNDNDRRAFIAILLSVAVYTLWMTWFAPPPPVTPIEAVNASAETTSTESSGGTTIGGPSLEGASTQASETPAPQPVVIDVPERTLTIEGNEWTGEIHSSNGAIRKIELLNYTDSPSVSPLYSWVFSGLDGEWNPYSGGEGPYYLLKESGAFVVAGIGSPDAGIPCLISEADTGVQSVCSDPSGVVTTILYTPNDDRFGLDVTVTFQNNSGQSQSDLWVGVMENTSGSAGRFENVIRPIAYVDEDIQIVDDMDDLAGPEAEVFDSVPSWFGVGDRYFMSVLRPKEGTDLNRLLIDQIEDGRVGSFGYSTVSLDAGSTRTMQFSAFLGPKQLDILEPLGGDMEAAVELGWFGFFARILLFLLKLFQAGVVNWGIAILLLTMTVKLLFFPLTQKAFTSSRRMQALQPQLKEIREKHKDNRELQTQETMRIFKENNVNPMGGCLPTLIQLPVWLALYNVMLYSAELYDSSFLYIQDLTMEDPYGFLPFLYAILMIGQQRMMPTMANMDPAQQKIMKMMPVMFALFMFTFPSGLVLYFCCNILLTIGQQWLINNKYKLEPETN